MTCHAPNSLANRRCRCHRFRRHTSPHASRFGPPSPYISEISSRERQLPIAVSTPTERGIAMSMSAAAWFILRSRPETLAGVGSAASLFSAGLRFPNQPINFHTKGIKESELHKFRPSHPKNSHSKTRDTKTRDVSGSRLLSQDQKQEENSQKRTPGQLWSSAEMPSVVLRSPFMAEIMISRLLFVEPPAQTRRKLLY